MKLEDYNEESFEEDNKFREVLKELDLSEDNLAIEAKIFRIEGKNIRSGSNAYLFTVDSDFSGIEERIKSSYGSGKYLINIHESGVDDETGKSYNRFRARKIISIEAAAGWEDRKTDAGSQDLNLIMETMGKQQRDLFDRMELIAKHSNHKSDPGPTLAVVAAVLPGLLSIVQAMISKPKDKVENPVTQLRDIMQLGNEAGMNLAGKEEEPNIMSMVNKHLPGMMDLAKKETHMKEQQAQVGAMMNTLATADNTEIVKTKEEVDVNVADMYQSLMSTKLLDIIKPFKDMLLLKAREKADPVALTNKLWHFLSPENKTIILTELLEDDWMTTFGHLDPKFISFSEWLMNFRDALLDKGEDEGIIQKSDTVDETLSEGIPATLEGNNDAKS